MIQGSQPHPFKRNYGDDQSAEATERRLARHPFALQIKRGDDWVLMGKADALDPLIGAASVLDNYPRRLLNRNTILLTFAVGEKVGQQ